jgi:hypothetical protein
MDDQSDAIDRSARPRRRDLLLGGGALAAATVASVGVASPAGAATTAPVYMPFGPERIYDSREVDGPLHSNEGRILAPEIAPDPAELAHTYNLTVTGTQGTGFLAVFPADILWPGNSSINWFGPNQIIANNVFTAFDNTGGIAVLLGGGGSTDFVLDIVAMSVVTDLPTVASMRARQARSHKLVKRA